MRRRAFLRVAGASGVGMLAGCVSSGDTDTPTPGENEVLVGPNNSRRFVPETLTVSPGTTVTWTFESSNHNVSCQLDNWESATLPDGADPFASYEGTNSYATLPVGETFEYTFEVPGTYDYVCVPHVTNGMVATVVVSE